MTVNPSCDRDNSGTRQQWAQVTEKLLRPNTNKQINPLRVLSDNPPTSNHDVTIQPATVPCTTVALTDTSFPRLVPPTTITRASNLTIVQQLQEANIKGNDYSGYFKRIR